MTRGYRDRPNVDPLPVNLNTVRQIIADGDAEVLVTTAEALGQNLVAVGLATSQIRNIFGTARKLQANWVGNPQRRAELRRELVLLKPKLDYQAAREAAVKPLKEWLIPAINLVYEAREDQQAENTRFQHFMDFFEATLAYHTAHGGKQDKGRQ